MHQGVGTLQGTQRACASALGERQSGGQAARLAEGGRGRSHLDVLLDHVGDDRDAADDDLHRLGQHGARELLDGLREGRREGETLPAPHRGEQGEEGGVLRGAARELA